MQEGQVYIPIVNWMLLFGCVTLAWTFGSSASLAAAYDLAVSGVMVITSIAMIPVALRKWGWSPAMTALVWGPLTALNAAFFAASSLKLFEGSYVPIAVGTVAFAAMATWRWGRKATYAAQDAKATMTVDEVVSLHRPSGRYLERNALIMTVARSGQRYWRHLGLRWLDLLVRYDVRNAAICALRRSGVAALKDRSSNSRCSACNSINARWGGPSPFPGHAGRSCSRSRGRTARRGNGRGRRAVILPNPAFRSRPNETSGSRGFSDSVFIQIYTITAVETMSAAFTREEGAETAAEVELPDRPISAHPNLVTG